MKYSLSNLIYIWLLIPGREHGIKEEQELF